MNIYPESLEDLVLQFQKLPSIGRKGAERLAMSIVETPENEVSEFAQSLLNVKNKIKKCKVCGNISEDDLCNICKSINRDESVICVVEDFRNLMAIEKSGVYDGLYHVLGGLISPSDNVSSEDINIDNLRKRLKKNTVKEVILALPLTFEGEATSYVLSSMLKDYSIKISRISAGVPVGSTLEYNDQLTLERAILDRREINE